MIKIKREKIKIEIAFIFWKNKVDCGSRSRKRVPQREAQWKKLLAQNLRLYIAGIADMLKLLL